MASITWRAPSHSVLLIAIMSGLLIAAALFWPRSPPKASAPRLAVVSSLPLRWSEQGVGDTLRGDAAPLPVWRWLDQRYPLRTVDRIDAKSLAGTDIVLLVQPRRLAPSELAAVDTWIRTGGQAIIFADPALVWSSDLPPGDTRRPVYTSLLSPLFAHWGIDLTLPMDRAERLVTATIEGVDVVADVGGAWVARGGPVSCAIEAEALIARCTVGEGNVLLVADADLLDARLWQRSGWAPWSDRDSTMVWLGVEISKAAASAH